MKGIKTFSSQDAATAYFGKLVSRATSYWPFTDARRLIEAFVAEFEIIEKAAAGSRHAYRVLVAILAFLEEAMDEDDNTTHTSYQNNVERCAGGLTGEMHWHGQWTDGRFVKIFFVPDQPTRMYYDTGYDYDRDRRVDVPKGPSEFLGLPDGGCEDMSAMSREEFYALAFPQIPADMTRRESA